MILCLYNNLGLLIQRKIHFQSFLSSVYKIKIIKSTEKYYQNYFPATLIIDILRIFKNLCEI